MLQELAARTGASAWVVASMLFFIAVYVAVAVRVYRTPAREIDAQSRMALDTDDERDATTHAQTQA